MLEKFSNFHPKLFEGMLHVRVSGFHLDSISPNVTSLESVLGFSIDKTVSDTINPYVENTDYSCILDKALGEKEKAGIIRFILDFDKGLTRVKCSDNVKSITILDKEQEKATGGALSDEGLFNRPKREDEAGNYERRNFRDENSDIESIFGSPLEKEIEEHNRKEKEDKQEMETLSSSSHSEKAVSVKEQLAPVKETKPVKEPVIRKEEPVLRKEEPVIRKEDQVIRKEDQVIRKGSSHPGPVFVTGDKTTKPPEPTDAPLTIPLKIDENGYFETSFYIYIMNEKLEGLYR